MIDRWHGVHAGLVPDENGPLVKYEDYEAKLDACAESAGEWKERAKEAEGKLYPIDGEHLEASRDKWAADWVTERTLRDIDRTNFEKRIIKLEAENKTLGEANKWLTYGIGSWCHKADMATVEFKAKIGGLVKQYESAAESMRKGQAHPHVPGIWDSVVKDLKKVI
jgi:hypothetical protein